MRSSQLTWALNVTTSVLRKGGTGKPEAEIRVACRQAKEHEGGGDTSAGGQAGAARPWSPPGSPAPRFWLLDPQSPWARSPHQAQAISGLACGALVAGCPSATAPP